jgi:hypothetical protein
VARKVSASLDRILAAYWDFIGHDQARINSEHLNECDGAFNYRPVRGSSTLSNHARGAAIDWAADYNPLGQDWHPSHGMLPVEFIQAFQAEGWRWGGLYKGRKDPMHFEGVANEQPPVTGDSELPLDVGSVGPRVLQVQTAVGADQDSIYGEKTKAAVAAWQTAHNLDANGVVGAQTWAIMFVTPPVKPPVVPTPFDPVLQEIWQIILDKTRVSSAPGAALEGARAQPALSGGAAIYQKLFSKFQQSSVIGVIPPDGAQFGITSGSANQWAIFGTAVADAESGFDSRTRNTSDPGGSFGIFQYAHSQVPGGNAFDVDASCSAFVRDCGASAHGGLRAGILGKRFSTIGSHPDRTRAKLAEATKLAASVVPPVVPPPPPRDSSNINKQLEAFVQLASTVLPIISTFVPQLKMLIPILPVLTGLLKMGDDIAQAGNDPAKVADALAGHLKGVAQQVQAVKLPGQS